MSERLAQVKFTIACAEAELLLRSEIVTRVVNNVGLANELGNTPKMVAALKRLGIRKIHLGRSPFRRIGDAISGAPLSPSVGDIDFLYDEAGVGRVNVSRRYGGNNSPYENTVYCQVTPEIVAQMYLEGGEEASIAKKLSCLTKKVLVRDFERASHV